jgi:hypothetical protein
MLLISAPLAAQYGGLLGIAICMSAGGDPAQSCQHLVCAAPYRHQRVTGKVRGESGGLTSPFVL